jgi:hypothetical protein
MPLHRAFRPLLACLPLLAAGCGGLDRLFADGERQRLADEVAAMEARLAILPELRVAAQPHQRLGFHGRSGEPAWIEIELERESALDEIVLFPVRTADPADGDAASGFPQELRVLGAGADDAFHPLAEWRQPADEAAFDPPFLRLPLAGAPLRRLRLEVRGGQPRGRGRFFALGEVVLLAGGTHRALGAPVRASEGILNPPRCDAMPWQENRRTSPYSMA